MDALELLHEDHAKVKELFEEAEGTKNQKEKERIFEGDQLGTGDSCTDRRDCFLSGHAKAPRIEGHGAGIPGRA